MYANVIVNISSSNVDQKFEYLVPNEYTDYISVGSRVTIPFGNSNRIIMGYVLELYSDKKFLGEEKSIIELLDLKPLISLEQLKLAYYISSDTICPLIRVLNLMIPQGMQAKTYKYLRVLNFNNLDGKLALRLSGKDSIVLNKNFDIPMSKINTEIKKGNLEITYEAKQSTNYSFVDTFIINKEYAYANLYLIKNDLVKDYLLNGEDGLTKNEIIDNYGLSLYMINSLTHKGFLTRKKKRIIRIKQFDLPIKDLSINEKDELNINSYDKPYLVISNDDNEEINHLLNLIKKVIKNNQNVVVFTPNILSSYKYSSIIRKEIGDVIACLNSKLTSAEIFDYYTNILENKYRIIVTTTACSLFPFQNVGMYIMLNEESSNYFNEQSPRFDMHRIVNYLSYNYHIPFVMMSTSPSVKSYCYSLDGRYYLIDNSVKKNINNVTTIDLKDELLKGNNTFISGYVSRRIKEVTDKKGKVLLIVNNKNTSNYVLCRSCGQTLRCPNCDISYNYNNKTNMLICPSCGKRETFSNTCPYCGNSKFHFGGVGMENIYDLLKNEYANELVLLKDFDDLDEFVDSLNLIEDKSSIIITSDLIAKSAILTKIDLGIIVNFDAALKAPSFDANSYAYAILANTYSYLKDNGELIVQTSNLDASPLKRFIQGDYHEFIRDEIALRKQLRIEPFYQVNRIIVKGKYEEIFKIAQDIKFSLKGIAGNKVFILGPSYSKLDGGVVLIVKHRFKEINQVYMNIYERYQNNNNTIIFDKYARRL